jgi:hypothetical protein
MQGENFGAITYQEDKRCMLVFLKSARIFRGGVRLGASPLTSEDPPLALFHEHGFVQNRTYGVSKRP